MTANTELKLATPTSLKTAVLEAKALAIGHGRKPVAQGLNLRVEKGEVLALLGPNGGGKTTFFRTLLGLLPPLAGEVVLDHRPLAQWPRRVLAQRLAYVPQAYASHFSYAVLEVVLMGRAAHLGHFAQPGEADREIAWHCLQRMGIAHLAHRSEREISGGERQLALIARALAQQPRLLVMDEPTANLDFGNQQRVLDHIQALRSQGIAVLMCTHQPEHATLVADRVALLHQGKLLGPGAAAVVATADNLAKLYGVEPHQLRERMPRNWPG